MGSLRAAPTFLVHSFGWHTKGHRNAVLVVVVVVVDAVTTQRARCCGARHFPTTLVLPALVPGRVPEAQHTLAHARTHTQPLTIAEFQQKFAHEKGPFAGGLQIQILVTTQREHTICVLGWPQIELVSLVVLPNLFH